MTPKNKGKQLNGLINLGMLGAGSHANYHGKALEILASQTPREINLAAVCDLDISKARAFTEKYGFQAAYTSLEEMLEQETLSGLLAITPTAITESIVSSLIPKEIPILIEKPPGRTSQSAKRLLDLAKRYGAKHMVSFNRRFSPPFKVFHDWIRESPEAGKPFFCSSRILRHKRLEPEFITSTGIHITDATNMIMGNPKDVSAVRIPMPSGNCTHYTARVSYEEGKVADLIFAPDAGIREESYEIHGEGYRAFIETMVGSISICRDNTEVLSWEVSPEACEAERNGTLMEMRYFIEYIKDSNLPVPQLADGLKALKLSEAIAEAPSSKSL